MRTGGEVGMSIRVNDFQWEPGKNDAEYIKLLESSRDDWQKIAQKAIAKLKKLSKEQDTGKVNITITQSDGWKEGNCPFCSMKVDSFYNWSFCGTCGKGLKWE